MFRHPNAIFRLLHVPRKILQFCLRLGWMWIMVQPAAAEFAAAGCTERTIIHIHRDADKTGVAYEERVTP
jgi:hypothetical protein